MFTNKAIDIEGNWYEPVHYLRNKASVIKAELIDTTSSAGDWSGYFIQKVGNKFYVIPFTQENNWPSTGFTLYTNDAIASFEAQPDNTELDELMDYYYQNMMF